MAISQGVCKSFKLESLQAIHDLEGDTIKVALYSDSASLSPDTAAYTATGEVSASGYTAGGAASNVTLSQSNQTVEAVFANVSWTADITARGALIYNSSKANRAIAVLNFGADREDSSGTFTLRMPAAGSDFPILKFS